MEKKRQVSFAMHVRQFYAQIATLSSTRISTTPAIRSCILIRDCFAACYFSAVLLGIGEHICTNNKRDSIADQEDMKNA